MASVHLSHASLRNLLRSSACVRRCVFSINNRPAAVQQAARSACATSRDGSEVTFSQAHEPSEVEEADSSEWVNEHAPQPSASVRSLARDWPEQQLETSLYIVPTPIGNMADITLRALQVLRSASLVLAEDTRHTRKLLNYYGLRAETLSCHDHNEKQRVASVIQRLREGQALALVSDAGMPGISDPGHKIITAAIRAGMPVTPLPGPCAFISALVASGLPTDTFTFYGFLPPKSTARCKRLSQLRDVPGTLVFYAPPHGLVSVLADMVAVLGANRRVCVARELTKVHEEFFRSTLQGALDEFRNREPLGEICILLEGADGASDDCPIQGPVISSDAEASSPASPSVTGVPPAVQAKQSQLSATQDRARPMLQLLIQSGVPMSAAAKDVAKQLGVSRKELYETAMQVQAQVRNESS